ncbi:hypothetical protein [Membranihabitans maritimus]|uniref:hypothetical protein n=1 Tax=Membranihabitans maritimus TaxID=2904244 RepID=UPI001F24C40E|nr:hypothetical protein [Membranihabitans maritimus]
MLKKFSSLSVLALSFVVLCFFISSCEKDPLNEFMDQDLRKNKSKLVDSSFSIDELFDSTFQLEDVINTDGKGTWHRGIPIGLFRQCFELVPPITLTYPDSTQVTYDGVTELKKDLKLHFDESEVIPEVMYPITLRHKDGTLQEIPDQETLINTVTACLPFGFINKIFNNGKGNGGIGNGKGNSK